MSLRFSALAALLFVLAPASSAQQPDTLGAYRDLDAQVRDLPLSGAVYFSQLEEAWDRAIVSGRYGRADSVATLAELYTVETMGAARGSTVWPSNADRLALAFFQGRIGAFGWLEDDGRWWQMQTPQPTYYGEYTLSRRPILDGYWILRESTWNTLSENRESVLDALREAGADDEQQALAAIIVEKMRSRPMYLYITSTQSIDQVSQRELNKRADAFLERFPGSRYESFVRKQIRNVYNVQGSMAFYFGLGAGGGNDNLGETTGINVAGELGIGVRYGFAHGNIGFHGNDLSIKQDIDGAGRDFLAEGERLTLGLLSVDVGPRIAIGGLDILPYVSGGVLFQNVSARGENEPTISTYDPPTTLGYGYGLALEFLPNRSERYGGTAVRFRVGQIEPRFDRGFEETLSGSVTYASLGLTLSGILRTRDL